MWFRPAPSNGQCWPQYLGIGFLCACGRKSAQMVGGVLVAARGLLTRLLCSRVPPPCGHSGDCRGELVGGCGPRDSQLFVVMSD